MKMLSARTVVRKTQQPCNRVRVVLKNELFNKALFTILTLHDGSIVFDPSAYLKTGDWNYNEFVIPPGPFSEKDISAVSGTGYSFGDIGPKFTYHRSGWITAGKREHHEQRRIKAQAMIRTRGHIFTLELKGFGSFEDAKRPARDCLNLYPLIPAATRTVKIVGYLGRLNDFVAPGVRIPAQPSMNVRLWMYRNGKVHECHLFSIRLANGAKKWLKLEYQLDNLATPHTDPTQPAASLIMGWNSSKAQNLSNEMRIMGLSTGAGW